MHHSSYHRMSKFVQLYLNSEQKLTIVDYGSQDVNGNYRALFTKPNWKYIGVDMVQGNNVDLIIKDLYSWAEIPSNSVDVFVSGQTFEHIEYIWLSMLEIRRVLRVNGCCCIIAPSQGEIHRFPVDCWRIQVDGLRALAKYAKLDVILCEAKWEQLSTWNDGSNLWDDVVLIARKVR